MIDFDTQFWLYLLFAALVGALLAYMFGLMKNDTTALDTELTNIRKERDGLLASLNVGSGGGSSQVDYDRRIAGLEAELVQARMKADELAAAKAKASHAVVAVNDEDANAMKWRNRYLEARVKFLEDQAAQALLSKTSLAIAVASPVAPVEAVTNANFTPSSLADLSGAELEIATLAVVANATAPPRGIETSKPDNLLLIDGVGPKNQVWLYEQGIYYYHQIATMTVENIAWLAENLPTFGSRVYLENWVAQCTKLARGIAVLE